MSSIDGSPITSEESSETADATLQFAPRNGDGPDMGALKKSYETCIANVQPYVDQCRINFRTRYALWNGQSSDGKKHAREGSKVDPTPWEGASDLRVFLTDEAINSKVAMQCMAFQKANIVAQPVEGNDIKRAKDVANFMRWMINTKIPHIDREVELLANYLNEKGVAATGQFWEVKQEKTLVNVTLQDLQAQFPQLDIATLIFTVDAEENAKSLLEAMYGVDGKKAGEMLVELRDTQKTSAIVTGKKKSYPVVRAFNLDCDLFIPDTATDIETAPAIFRVQYFSPEQLRSFINSDGWDEEWVEAAIEKCKGQQIALQQNEFNQTISRSFIYNQQRMTDLVGVVYAYQRLSDEEGIPGIYLTIFNPQLPPDKDQPGYAKHGLLGFAHGEYPFVLHRREFLSRRLHDSRGIPEPGKPWQDQIKVHLDSRIDAASIAISPPLGYPLGRPPLKWGANARVPERRPNEYHYLDRPQGDVNTEKSQELLQASFNRYFGFASAEGDATFSSVKNQLETDKFLSGWSDAFRQVWALYKQFGDEQVYFRVIGLKQQDPVDFKKGNEEEEFDFMLNFSLDSANPESMEKKIEALAKICATFDKYGQVDYSEVLQLAVETIEPTWAERIIQPKDTGTQKLIDETHSMLAQVYSGVERDINLNAPPDIVMQTIQNYAQAPDVQQRYREDEAFKARLDKIVKQTQMQQMQIQNKKIGRYGA